MDKRSRIKEFLLVVGAGLLVAVGLYVALQSNRIGLMILVGAALAAIASGFVLVLFRRIQIQIDSIHRELSTEFGQRTSEVFSQMEAIEGIYATLKPRMPLAATRGWAASPDFLRLVIQNIMTRRPKVVVEASSGVSTVVIAYCLKIIGSGQLLSLEHESKYADATRVQLRMHGLDNNVKVLDAPLAAAEIEGEDWLWYDLNQLELEGEIDLLVIDGPPMGTQHLARYPALPLLRNRMANDSMILMDDGSRIDEQSIVKRWQDEFKAITAEYLDLEKGAFSILVNSDR